MFQLSVPWWEFVLRGVVVYLFLLFFLRITGRRQIGQACRIDHGALAGVRLQRGDLGIDLLPHGGDGRLRRRWPRGQQGEGEAGAGQGAAAGLGWGVHALVLPR